ncbi:two-component system, OmpR family, response regulator RegX3 [Ferrithrix thermotolerans DSM 19514]|jgi:two-component system response regulator RegX3|uniref:Sensory transduction protein RegX3 n=1 Tax=Ferrithrix thermotolerans DSM 19514 TaxID=1121881 RepID=A0A1M4TZF6_9ACTN|nr:response regulator transcription factor [Ferrithrix thermotolerans]SHE49724.1 two-component system, OmpR family, response regulator RegX3 [Ferrithrix thermotolerans DSM 19514]
MTRTQPIVLIAEDEESFIEVLTLGLKREGFLVEAARDGEEALRKFEEFRPDVILLDVMLPRKSGLDVCREIRLHSKVPIIMVTAKSTEIDTVVGLEVGADDYVAKPYRLKELVARVRAVMRRTPMEPDSSTKQFETIEVGDIILDTSKHEVKVRGEVVKVPLKEFELLEFLISNPGRVLTREQIIDRVWGPYYSGDTKTLDVHIKRLRSKVEIDPSDPKVITTVRGLGYRLETSR